MYRFIKRALDILFSSIAIIVFLPLILVLMFIIKITMGGPVIFTQKRIGQHNKIFTLYKFRSMKNTKNSNGDLLPDAERITKFGNFLRKSSLDEIPQIFNIFLGHMSFIGPRPKTIYEVLLMEGTSYVQRHKLKPGLSSWSVIHGRNNMSNDKMLQYDLEHVQKNSFSLDVLIFFKTLLLVIMRVGISTEGHATFKHLADFLVEKNIKTKEEVLEIEKNAQKIESSKNKILLIQFTPYEEGHKENWIVESTIHN